MQVDINSAVNVRMSRYNIYWDGKKLLLTTASHKEYISLHTTAYTLKALALAGAFYFINLANNPTNQHSIPGTIERSKY